MRTCYLMQLLTYWEFDCPQAGRDWGAAPGECEKGQRRGSYKHGNNIFPLFFQYITTK